MGLRAAGPAEYAIKYTGLRFLLQAGAFLQIVTNLDDAKSIINDWGRGL